MDSILKALWILTRKREAQDVHVAEHSLAMAAVAVQLTTTLTMAHAEKPVFRILKWKRTDIQKIGWLI